jgi:cell division protein FtsW (lipid II flippase)
MKKLRFFLFFGLATSVLALLLVYLFLYNKPHRDFERARPALQMSAESLYRAFAADERTAESEFIGKVLEITGEVYVVEETNDMVIVAFVFEEGFFGGEGVRCTMLENHHQKALQLKPGQEVAIKGYCTGFTGSDVILENCSFP